MNHPIIIDGKWYKTVPQAAADLSEGDPERAKTIGNSMRKALNEGRGLYLGYCIRYADDVDAEKPIKTRPDRRIVGAPLIRRPVTTRLGYCEGRY